MKKIIFFDLDNTLHSTKKKEVPEQTIRLLKELASKPDVVLGLATGRGPTKVYLLGDLLDLFTYRIYINGAVAYYKDELIYDNPIAIEEIEKVLKLAENQDISIGFVAKEGEYIKHITEEIDYGMKDFHTTYPVINEFAYLTTPIYQLWLFSKSRERIESIVNKVDLRYYPWHDGGADLVNMNTNKATAIKRVLENETNYQLITVGDGHNDIEMVEMAHIGIAMDNSGFDELKEKADHIAPHIDANQLYEFFQKLNIID